MKKLKSSGRKFMKPAILVTGITALLPSLASAQGLVDPLGDGVTVRGVLLSLLEAFIIIATPIVVMSIVYAGFLYVTARGNVEQTKQASTALTYAVIGGVILIGAVAISEIVANLVGSFTETD